MAIYVIILLIGSKYFKKLPIPYNFKPLSNLISKSCSLLKTLKKIVRKYSNKGRCSQEIKAKK